MSQFDVHRNTGRNSAVIPFVVIVQSAAFNDRRRRLVVPLVATDKTQGQVKFPTSRVNPTFTIAGIKVILNPFDMTSVAVDILGEQVGSLAKEGDVIMTALDEIFSQAWG
ncbi:MAG: CcdB family protein [Rhodoferax sp.]|nr:CcdB family protein [Rhodoferax sp.]